VAGGLVAVAVTGFLLGSLGVGVGLLADLAAVALVVALAALLVTLLSGGRVHCPGCRGWWR
jgi:hypothetical protein